MEGKEWKHMSKKHRRGKLRAVWQACWRVRPEATSVHLRIWEAREVTEMRLKMLDVARVPRPLNISLRSG